MSSSREDQEPNSAASAAAACHPHDVGGRTPGRRAGRVQEEDDYGGRTDHQVACHAVEADPQSSDGDQITAGPRLTSSSSSIPVRDQQSDRLSGLFVGRKGERAAED